MEHSEEAGIHSGDSCSVLPPYSLSPALVDETKYQVKLLARRLKVCGRMNARFAIQGRVVYLIEVNPRAGQAASAPPGRCPSSSTSTPSSALPASTPAPSRAGSAAREPSAACCPPRYWTNWSSCAWPARLALGATTYKLSFGHHGANVPVLNRPAGRVEITSQNHGFAVDTASPERAGGSATHVNLNDGSLEGFVHADRCAIALQVRPEASPGPHDAAYVFSRFVHAAAAGQAVNAGVFV